MLVDESMQKRINVPNAEEKRAPDARKEEATGDEIRIGAGKRRLAASEKGVMKRRFQVKQTLLDKIGDQILPSPFALTKRYQTRVRNPTSQRSEIRSHGSDLAHCQKGSDPSASTARPRRSGLPPFSVSAKEKV